MSTMSIPSGHPKKTLELLWKRVKQRGDLPGFSKVVGAILTAMRGEDEREFNMTKTVLSDPVLTQRVLRLANSAMYSVFGQGINTVSKAVIVLGTDSIGHLALGLKLIDGLSAATADSASARKEMEKALLAGHIARQVASSASTRDVEEAVVCSMLHGLGRMMVTFYLSDRWALVQARCVESGCDEAHATHELFGLGLDEIGRLVAQQWGLPPELVNSLQDVLPQEVGEPLAHAEWLAAVSTMSSRCARVLCEGDAASGALAAIVDSYADMLGLDAAEMLGAVEAASKAAEEDAVFVAPSNTPAVEENVDAMQPTRKPADAALILTRGVADMRGAARSVSTRQLMTMALEAVYQGLGLTRAIAFLRNHEEAKYIARMCFGENLQELLPRLMFDDAYQPDVFHAALANDKIIFVENAQDPAFINKLPRWWRDTLPTAHSFMVLPLTVNRHSVGFIYGDWDGPLSCNKLEPAEILPLDHLRALMVQAVEQRRQMAPAWNV
jgi:HD-like signal output (HDOD) protein